MNQFYDAVWNVAPDAWLMVGRTTDWIWQKLNGNFSAALFGALAGAYGAHRIALSKENRDRLVSAIEATNTAIGLSNVVANNFLALKRQHILGLLKRYEDQFYEMGQLEYAAIQAQQQVMLTVLADFRTLHLPNFPMQPLEDAVMQKVGPAIHAGSIVQNLKQAVEGFTQSMDRRLRLIGILAQLGEEEKVLRYYGLQVNDNIDENFPDVMRAIGMQVDDCIYFSMLLGEILVKHGKQLPDLLKRKDPKVVSLSYDNVPAEMLPDRNEFRDFERQYRAPDRTN